MGNYRHYLCNLILVVGGSMLLGSCRPQPASLLAKAAQAERVSADSVFFYLQQIAQPEGLPLEERGDYCLLSYRATLWKTGISYDSLLQKAIRCYSLAGNADKRTQARIERGTACLYRNELDSLLQQTDEILKNASLDEVQKSRLYGLRRAAYLRKHEYDRALDMADSSRLWARKSGDTSVYFSTSRLYLNLLKEMHRDDASEQGYRELSEEILRSPRYRFLNSYLWEDLLKVALSRKDYRKALQYLQQLSSSAYSRNEVPRYLLLRGKTYDALHQADSASYYYRLAAASSSPFVAMEANTLLFHLVNKEEYPEQAFYIKQKEKTLRDDILVGIHAKMQEREFNELKLQNELYQLHLAQQKKELWMLGGMTVLLGVGLIVLFFFQKEKKKRLRRENQLLHQEAELSSLREKESSLRNKEAELREALFRRIAFFRKLPSLQPVSRLSDEEVSHCKIAVTDAEWAEVISVVNDAFDNFVLRLQKAYPSLSKKDIGFCCLVKINVSLQDLSDIYCVGKAAITKRKYRIKTDKLGIAGENTSLDSFLKSF